MARSGIDKGFDLVEGASSGVEGENIFLFRLPKDVEFTAIDGINISSMMKDTSKGRKTTPITYNGSSYVLSRKSAGIYQTLRPIVSKDLSTSNIGGEVDGFFDLTQVLQSKVVDEEESTGIEIPESYMQMDQVPNLQLNAMPTGSFTDVEDVRQKCRSDEVAMAAGSSSKKSSKTKGGKNGNVSVPKSPAKEKTESPVTSPSRSKKHKHKKTDDGEEKKKKKRKSD